MKVALMRNICPKLVSSVASLVISDLNAKAAKGEGCNSAIFPFAPRHARKNGRLIGNAHKAMLKWVLLHAAQHLVVASTISASSFTFLSKGEN